MIGAASGMEHPTVLHLHLARVFLAPLGYIVRFAQLLSSTTSCSTLNSSPNPNLLNEIISQNQRTHLRTLRTHIQKWATQDQHKARLAVIHAAALFWHVRCFSIDGFYEAEAVFSASLVLWAYGFFAVQFVRCSLLG